MRFLSWLDGKRHGLRAWWANPFRRYWPARTRRTVEQQLKRRTP